MNDVTKFDLASVAGGVRPFARRERTEDDRALDRELRWRGRNEWEIRSEMDRAVQRRFTGRRNKP